jgi:hypothetical protein
MSQLIGQQCLQCGQVIGDYLAGSFCKGCGNPVHHACKSRNGERETATNCPACGCNPSTIAPPTAIATPERIAASDAAGYRVTHDDMPPRRPARPETDFDLRPPRRERPITLRGISSALGGLFLVALMGFGAYIMFRGTAGKLEPIVRNGLKERTGRDVKSVDLKQVRGSTYEGTALFANGELWDIHATVNGDQIVWRAAPPQAVMEQRIREMFTRQLKLEPKSVTISKGRNGMYSGTAEAVTGQRFKVVEREDGDGMLHFNPNPGPRGTKVYLEEMP